MKDAPAFGVVLFHTSSAALRAEKKLIEHGLVIKLIPTARELSSNCGIALLEYLDRERVTRRTGDERIIL